jgi:uncharacterized protein (TIGR00299 family) protein
MDTLAFDGRMGASGDMLLGALLAAGADRSALDPVEDRLDVRYEVAGTTRCGISATTVDVLVEDRADRTEQPSDGTDNEHSRDHEQGSDHGHDHEQDGDHGHDHEQGGDHGHSNDHAEGSGPERSYTEVVGIVESMELPAPVEQDALAIFELLGEAEARIHDTALASTHFHEVGADDAIADIVGCALLLAELDPDRIVTTPLATGGGEVSMSHGVYPVPTPAVVELAERADWSVRGGPVEGELLTPTGAAILTHVASGVDSLPALDVDGSGYGAGSRSFEGHPNVLRALVGEGTGGLREEPVTVLETNLDDAPPELLGSLQETLTAAGALDVAVLPTTMKKSRPGHLVKVIVAPEDTERVARRLAAETGTLGVREHGSGHRFVADRAIETVRLDLDGRTFEVDVKVARFQGHPGEVFDVSTEHDDALRVAGETGLPVREVRRLAESRARDTLV